MPPIGPEAEHVLQRVDAERNHDDDECGHDARGNGVAAALQRQREPMEDRAVGDRGREQCRGADPLPREGHEERQRADGDEAAEVIERVREAEARDTRVGAAPVRHRPHRIELRMRDDAVGDGMLEIGARQHCTPPSASMKLRATGRVDVRPRTTFHVSTAPASVASRCFIVWPLMNPSTSRVA